MVFAQLWLCHEQQNCLISHCPLISNFSLDPFWPSVCIYGLVQERHNSSALAMELLLSCTNPSISCHKTFIIVGSGNSLLLSTKQLPEPVLTYGQKTFIKFKWMDHNIENASGFICGNYICKQDLAWDLKNVSLQLLVYTFMGPEVGHVFCWRCPSI